MEKKPLSHILKGSTRPRGQETRGKTASNRLRRVDNFFLMYEPGLFSGNRGGLFLDLGYGFTPGTTLESASRFRRVNPGLPVLGVEIDQERVDQGKPFEDGITFFRRGGFNLPLLQGEKVKALRAFNVLRQYKEDEVVQAHSLLAHQVEPGGILVEGTSDPFGRIWTANVIRSTEEGFFYEALVFSLNLRFPFEPAVFQPVLPKNYIHRVIPGETVFQFFSSWKEAYNKALPGGGNLLASSARILGTAGYNLNLQKRWLSRGFLIWYISNKKY